jgi:hypothetical protein
MLAYFIRDLLVAQVSFDPKPLISQRFRHVPGVVGLCVGDAGHHHLHRRQPHWQRAGVLLDQDADEALEAADDGAVQHDGAMPRAVFADVFGVQPLGHVRVHLDGAALPLAAQRVLQGVFDLGAVERALARQVGEFAARRAQAVGQRGLGLVPAFLTADARLGARRQLVDDVAEAEVLVDLLQQLGEGRHFGLDHGPRCRRCGRRPA